LYHGFALDAREAARPRLARLARDVMRIHRSQARLDVRHIIHTMNRFNFDGTLDGTRVAVIA
jgi:hypothetical protein